MSKERLIELFEESATLLELKGESPFKSRAYSNAARVLAQMEGDLHESVQNHSLMEYKGIGKAIFEKIAEGIQTGRLSFYEELKASTPPGLLEMLKIKGLGPKKIRIIYDQLGIEDIVGLEYACIENRLVDLPGFGKKTQDKIREGIVYQKRHKGFYHSHTARSEGERLLALLLQKEEVVRASLAGSLRRRNEVVKDIDLVVSSGSPFVVMDYTGSLPGIEKEVSRTENSAKFILKTGIMLDLHVVSEDRFPYMLYYYTGSKAYHDAIYERAKNYGMMISEYGLFLDDHMLPCQDEQEIFSTLELDYIAPELRENNGEIEVASRHRLPRLVEEREIRGIFHVHSTYSDGAAPLAQMVEAAERLGFEYIGISDHSQSAFYANGLKEDQIKKQHEEIDRLQEQFRIRIFKGIESDILPDGSLDYDDRILALFDFVIASVHSSFNMSEEEMTQRIVRAIGHPATTFLGHPTGRILLSREGYRVNIPEVIAAAHRHGVAIELNASPYRLDLDWRYCKLAKEAGVRLSIHPDAHGLSGLTDVRSGVGIARKGWLSSDDLVNTLSLNEMEIYLEKKKNQIR
jgi:DNA polymerase (family 10)